MLKVYEPNDYRFKDSNGETYVSSPEIDSSELLIGLPLILVLLIGSLAIVAI